MKLDFKPQQVHHILTDFNLVYIHEKVFTNDFRICKLVVDGAIFGYRNYKIVIKKLRKNVKSVLEARF